MASENFSLRRITTDQACELFGVSRTWLRDHAVRLGAKNRDASYDAIKLLAALRQDYSVAELPDESLELALQTIEALIEHYTIDVMPAIVENLDKIQARHGAAGLAAVAKLLLDYCSDSVDTWGHDSFNPKIDEAAIRKEAEDKIEALRQLEKRSKLQPVRSCECCNKYRWGSKWKPLPAPSGFFAEPMEFICELCEKKAA